MKRKNFAKPLWFFLLTFLLMLIGQSTAFGYIHPADPIVVLAALMMPAPAAILSTGLASIAADLIKEEYTLVLITLAIRILMVLWVKWIPSRIPQRKHEELFAAPALVIPVIGYFFGQLILSLLSGSVGSALTDAVGTLTKNSIQAAASVLIFLLLYDLVKGYSAAKAQIKEKEQEEKEKEEGEETDE